METKRSPLQKAAHFCAGTVDPVELPEGIDGFATRDHQVIRQWARRHAAQPATGEATVSGPATAFVNDGDAGIRFNFPAVSRFRPISWEEWLENFDRFRLTFVYDESGHYRFATEDERSEATP